MSHENYAGTFQPTERVMTDGATRDVALVVSRDNESVAIEVEDGISGGELIALLIHIIPALAAYCIRTNGPHEGLTSAINNANDAIKQAIADDPDGILKRRCDA